MNAAVTATGMSVKATTGTNLTISNAEDGTYDFTAALDPALASATMKPATSYNGTTFYRLKDSKQADQFDNYQIAALTFDNWSDYMTTTTSEITYVLSGTYYLKALEANSFNRIGVGIAFDNTQSAAIAKSLRVAVTIGETTKIYAPVPGFDDTYVTKSDTALATPTISTDSDLFTATIGTTAVPVTVKIWFEGQDENCHSANAVAAINVNPYAITLTFTGSKV